MTTSSITRTRSDLAHRLHDQEKLVGVILKMSSPASVELVGHLGFDLTIIDTEHGLSGGVELDHHLRAADSAGLPALVRISMLNRPEIQRALDGGAIGVIVPQVETRDMAQQAVSFAHYPPFGSRGMATSTRAGHQGTIPAQSYLASAQEKTVVIAQIESRAGIINAAEIIATEGISAIWIGLSDLSLDLGHFGDNTHPEVAAAIRTVLDQTHAAGIPLMVIADTDEDAETWINNGANVLLINLLTVLARGLRSLRDSHKARQIQQQESPQLPQTA